jgi:hypothetical protein
MRQVVEAKMCFDLQGKTEKVQGETPAALRWFFKPIEPTRGYRRPGPRRHLYMVAIDVRVSFCTF